MENDMSQDTISTSELTVCLKNGQRVSVKAGKYQVNEHFLILNCENGVAITPLAELLCVLPAGVELQGRANG